MNAEGWKGLIRDAVLQDQQGKSESLDLLSRHLEMCDSAKQELRNRGYGWTGLDILETVKEVENLRMQRTL